MMPTPTATLANVAIDATHLSHPGDIPIDPALPSETAAQAQAAVHQPGDLSVPRFPPETPCTGRPPDVHGPETASIQPGAPDELPPLISSTEDTGIRPPVNGSGERVQRAEFEQLLDNFKRKEPLLRACAVYNIRVAKSATLAVIRSKIANHWYPRASQRASQPRTSSQPKLCCASDAVPPPPSLPASPSNVRRASSPVESGAIDSLEQDDEDALVARYDVVGAAAEQVLEYDEDGLDAEDEELDDDVINSEEAFQRFQVKTRVDAVKRFEDNRRAGGRKTQQANVKAWNLFIGTALSKGHVRDEIVDEHSLILYINHTAKRAQRNRRGEDIPGTHVGASQIKKEFFGALRIRKTQEAKDRTLAADRPATTVAVWDLLKAQMNEALQRARLGLVPAQDAPDIIANTFLSHITDEQRSRICLGFLLHRELFSAVKGFLAWTLCCASGKRGDDVRALKLCELQPYTLRHPNNLTHIPAILGLQAEDKAGQRGMQTTVNPRYACWIAHRNPLQCPLGALAFLLHFLYDQYTLAEKLDIKWDVNKSWRQVRLIFGSSPNAPYNEHNLYNLYCQAFKKADFESGIKAHLPRHELGYLQEQLGVDSAETARLGWSRDTYADVYAPSLPKKAILACHGYMEHEEYAPTRCKIPVPPAFLARMCPMAEDIIASIQGREGLVGATNHWRMVVSLRPHLFLCAAAIYQMAPESSIFRLPALAHDDVREWMKCEYPSQLAALEASEGDPISLERLQNTMIRQSLQHLSLTVQRQANEMVRLHAIVDRRTATFSSPKGFLPHGLPVWSASRGAILDFGRGGGGGGDESVSRDAGALEPAFKLIRTNESQEHRRAESSEISLFVDAETRAQQDTGVYEVDDSSLRAFVAPSPTSTILTRPQTQVNLVLPPAAAFTVKGQQPQLPNLGTGSVTWDKVFCSIVDTSYLWEVWKPPSSLDRSTVKELWDAYNTGTVVKDNDGNPAGMKPPLRLVEQHFGTHWRKTSQARKAWQRYREIPEWIDNRMRTEGIPPDEAITQLQERRQVAGSATIKGLLALIRELAEEHKGLASLYQTAKSSGMLPLPHGAAYSLSTTSSSSSLPPPSSPVLSGCSSSPPLPSLSSPGHAAELGPLASELTIKKRKRAAAIGARIRGSKKRKRTSTRSP